MSQQSQLILGLALNAGPLLMLMPQGFRSAFPLLEFGRQDAKGRQDDIVLAELGKVCVLATSMVDIHLESVSRFDMALNFFLPLPHQSDRSDDKRRFAAGVVGRSSTDEGYRLYSLAQAHAIC